MKESQYKTVTIEYRAPRRIDFIELVTDITYHGTYIVVTYLETIDKEATRIITMNDIEEISIKELNKYDVNRTLMLLSERTAGEDFTKLKFCPWDGAKSSVTLNVYGRYRQTELAAYTFDKVTKIERKWSHDLRGHEILIHFLDVDRHVVLNGVGQIVVFAEEDIKSMLIQRTDMPDKKININGGKYDAES